MGIPNELNSFNQIYQPYFNAYSVYRDFEEYETLIANLGNNSNPAGALQSLENLLQDLKKHEDEFYKQIGDPNLVNTRLAIWNNCFKNYDILHDKQLFQEILSLFKVALTVENRDENNTKAISAQEFLQTNIMNFLNSDKGGEFIEGKTELTFANVLNAMGDSLSNNKNKSRHFSNNKNSSISNVKITIKRDKNQLINEVTVTPDVNDTLSDAIKRKIVKKFNITNINKDAKLVATTDIDSNNTNVKAEDKQGDYTTKLISGLLTIFNEKLANADRTIQKIFQTEIKTELQKKNYNVSNNYSVVMGFVGEIYWNAFAKYVFNNQNFQAVGNIKDESGKSISIDMILKDTGIGFQIKNWQKIDQNHVTRNDMYLDNFFQRIIKNEGYLTIIARRYGMASYNKPDITAFDSLTNDKFEEYQNFYNTTLNNNLTDELQSLCSFFIPQIIGITNVTAKELQGQFQNTFWLISDKIIPSSIIIKELIDEMSGTIKDNRYVKFKISSLKDLGDKGWKQAKKEKEKSQETSTLDVDMANRWKVGYQYTFKLSALIQDASKLSNITALINK